MMKLFAQVNRKLCEKKAQVLLPSVLLVPLFILVVYLLFDLTNLSMTKVQHQYALDNAAYSQMTTVSAYLNAVAMTNGPALYRVMVTYDEKNIQRLDQLDPPCGDDVCPPKVSVFDIFYQGGAFPALENRKEAYHGKPSPESTDWNFQYFAGNGNYWDGTFQASVKEGANPKHAYDGRKDWVKPNPKLPSEPPTLMSLNLIKNYKLHYSEIVKYFSEYLRWAFYLGYIFDNQKYMYQQLTNNAFAFRSGYSVNTGTCKPAECARQSARQLMPYLKINLIPFDLKTIRIQFTDYERFMTDMIEQPLTSGDLNAGRDIYMFAYVDPSSQSVLRRLEKGVVLKQPYKVPSNHFNKDLNTKYKPFTRNTIIMSCPRKGNNCVWPNPLPKYNVYLRP